MPNWQRARKPSQKRVRKEEILEAARRLFGTSSYDAVSLNGIAREAGMSKPNLYRYFSSREEIFLHILREEQQSFAARLSARLQSLEKGAEPAEIVGAWLEASVDSPELLALLPQLGTSLEKNSSLEQLVAYKKESFAGAQQLAELHHRLYPRLSVDVWKEVLNSAVALLAGLWPLCNGNEKVDEAMLHPEVGLEPWDFRKMMGFALESLILGAAQRASTAQSLKTAE
ncbi:MAG: TetR family transcriptional regulator [Candidatus Eremiobacteraeota bacterium]|nr:TetR family transcriptional regulator [Candidatus Eremiobacteraeota bacterium]